MSDLMTLLSGILGGGQQQGMAQAQPGLSTMQGFMPPPQTPNLPPPVSGDPIGDAGPRPGGGGFLEMLKGVLGGGAAAAPKPSAAAMNPDPEGARLGANIGGAALYPKPAPGPAPTTPFTPGDGRVLGDAPAPMPMTDELRRVFAGGDEGQGAGAGTGGGAGAPAVGQWQTQTQAAPAGGVTAGDVQRFIRSVATGAASVRPGAGKFSAFAQGAAGAAQSKYAEEERDKERASKSADKAFTQNLQTEELGLKKNQDARADRKEGREAGVSEARINYLNARAKAALNRTTNGTLDSKDISAFNAHMERWARRNKDAMSPEEFDKSYEVEAQRQIAQYSQKQIISPGQMKQQAAPGGGAPAAGSVAEGTMARNPKTGERLVFRGGQWVKPDAQPAQ